MANLTEDINAYLIEGREAWEETLETCLKVTRLCGADNYTSVGIDVSSWVEEGDYVSMEKLLWSFLDNFDKIDPGFVGEAYKEAHKARDRMLGGKVLMYKLAMKLEPDNLEKRDQLRENGFTVARSSRWGLNGE